MASSARMLPSASLSRLARSYGRSLQTWATNRTLRYALAVIFLLSAGVSLLGAFGVGLAVLFNCLAVKYGTYSAYGALAGLLVALALLGALVGILLLKRPMPPIPRPQRYLRAGGRAGASETMKALSSKVTQMRAKPAMPVMIGLTAAGLAGWLVLSRLHRS